MRSARRAALLGLLLAAALFFVWSPRERDAALESAEPTRFLAPSRAASSASNESLRVESESLTGTEASNETSEASANAREARAVLAGSSRAVGGAEILWWIAHEGPEEFERWLAGSQPDASLPPDVRRTFADGQGQFMLEDAGLALHVIARAPGLFGSASFAAGESSPLRVELHPELELRVRVVDTEGAPVERVHIELRAKRERERIVDASTDADGVARLVRWKGPLANWYSSPEVLWIVVDELFENTPMQAFPASDPPRDIVHFTLPSSGICEVRALDSDGAAARQDSSVQLVLVSKDTTRSGKPADLGQARRVSRGSAPGRPAVFEHVELGYDLVALVQNEDFDLSFQASGSGPSVPGERVVLEVRAANVGGITGRLLRLDGSVFANASVPLDGLQDADAEVGRTLTASLRTDAGGRFEVAISERTELGDGAALDAFECDSQGHALGRARLLLPSAAMTQRIELGDVRMEPLPIFASGRVRFATGEPAGGAMVIPDDAKQQSSWFDLDRPASSWRVRCDAQGRFELRLPLSAAQLMLTASKDGFTSEPVSVTAGSRDVELVLAPAATLAGRLLLHESVAADRLRVRVRESMEAPTLAIATPLSDGSFECRGLRPGTLLLEVYELKTTREFARVEGLRVEGPGTSRDARLEPLDLSSELRAITLSLVDVRGQPIARLPQVGLYHGGPQAEFECADARVRFLRGREPVDVLVACKSYLTEFLPNVRESGTVVLHEAPMLRFRLSESAHAALRGLMPMLTLQSVRERDFDDGQTLAFKGGRFVETSAIMAGEYRMALRLGRKRDESWAFGELPLLEPNRIEVVRGPLLQEFEVLCDPAELARVVAQLLDK